MAKPPKPPATRRFAIGLLLVALLFATFGRTAGHDLLGWDDKFHTTKNALVTPPSWEGFVRAWQGPYGNLYIPLSYNFFLLEARLSQAVSGGISPVVFHVGNLLLYAACTVLVWLLLRRLVNHDAGALVGALLFALHPIQAESVAWISETRGLLAGVFGFAALALHLRSPPDSRGGGEAFWAALLFLAAVLAKPSAAPLPVMAFLIDRFWLGRGTRSALFRVLPMLVLAAAALALSSMLQHTATKGSASPLWARPIIALDAISFYLRKLVWPFGFTPDYSRTPATLLRSPERFYTWLLACAPLLAFVRRDWRGKAAALYGTFIAGLAPVLGIVVFHHQRISTVADRYIFLSMLAPALLAAWLVSRAKSPRVLAVCVSLLGGLAILSFRQAGWWKDEQTLFSHALEVNPRSALAHTNLGFLLSEKGLKDEAVRHYEDALAINPDHAMALNNLASVIQKRGEAVRAEELFRRAIAADGSHSLASENLGLLLAEQGRLEEAITWLEEAVRLEPDRGVLHNSLGVVLERAGRRERAVQEYETALRANPRHVLAHVNLGLALAASGKDDEAVSHWEKAAELNDRQVDAHTELGKAYLKRGRLDLAERHLRKVSELRPDDVKALNNLGVVLIQQGRRDEAVACFRRALEKAPDFQSARENLERANAGR